MEDTSSPIGYEENYFVITTYIFWYSWTKAIFFTRGWRALFLVNTWSVTLYTWTPICACLNYNFSFLRVRALYTWTPKFVLLSFNMSFWRALHLHPWTLKHSIPDHCQLVFWLPMPGFLNSKVRTHDVWLLVFTLKLALCCICEMNLGTNYNAVSLNRKYFIVCQICWKLASLFVRFVGSLLLLWMCCSWSCSTWLLQWSNSTQKMHRLVLAGSGSCSTRAS